MSGDAILALCVIVISPAIGSFLGVLVERLPAGRDVVRQPSACAACGQRLGWRALVPILSYLSQNGRCADCNAPIPPHLLSIEIAALFGAVLAVALVPDAGPMVLTACILWCLIALFYTDLHSFRLPDPLTLALLIFGLIYAAIDPARVWFDGILSALIGALAFLAIRWIYTMARGREGLGLGDVKLIAGIGAALGWAQLPYVTLLAAILALGITAAQTRTAQTRLSGTTKLPFGAYLSAACAALLLI